MNSFLGSVVTFGFSRWINESVLCIYVSINTYIIRCARSRFLIRGYEWSLKTFKCSQNFSNCSQNFSGCSFTRAPIFSQVLAYSGSFFLVARKANFHQCSIVLTKKNALFTNASKLIIRYPSCSHQLWWFINTIEVVKASIIITL